MPDDNSQSCNRNVANKVLLPTVKVLKQPGFNCTCNRNCTILRLCTGVVQSQDWHAVSGFSAVLRLCKLLDCAEHIHILVPTPSHTAGMDLCMNCCSFFDHNTSAQSDNHCHVHPSDVHLMSIKSLYMISFYQAFPRAEV